MRCEALQCVGDQRFDVTGRDPVPPGSLGVGQLMVVDQPDSARLARGEFLQLGSDLPGLRPPIVVGLGIVSGSMVCRSLWPEKPRGQE